MITHEAFGRALARTFSGQLPQKVAVALSGGVDSLGLTYLLKQYRDTYQPNLEIHTVTIDHKYRDGSYEEACKIGALVKAWNISHSILQLSYDRNVKDLTNFEEVARTKRYEQFYGYCRSENIGALFVGHNLNDQLETFIQRLQQSSSLFGLVGLKERATLPLNDRMDTIHVYRPLLTFEKSEIIETCTHLNIEWFEDSTNKDIHLTKRNFIRYLQREVIEDNDQSIISKENLVQTHEELVSLTDMVLQKVYSLYCLLTSQDMIQMDDRNGRMHLRIPISLINQENTLVLSRFLYIMLYSISSIKHYHWSYGKVERQLVPQLIKQTKPCRLTYLNLMFTCQKDVSFLTLDIQRQPMLRDHDSGYEIKLSDNWSEWKIFDRRFWLRFRSEHITSGQVIPYNHLTHRKLLHPSLGFKTPTKRMDGIPVLMNNNQIISFPTHNVSIPELTAEYKLKSNIWLTELRLKWNDNQVRTP